jgi:hypothetical protein
MHLTSVMIPSGAQSAPREVTAPSHSAHSATAPAATRDAGEAESSLKRKTMTPPDDCKTEPSTSKKRRVRGALPVVADMMGGVGPFGVPLAKSGLIRVYCNGKHVMCEYIYLCSMCRQSLFATTLIVYVWLADLNPESFKYMLKNRDSNKCDPSLLTCYNKDGRVFIWDLLRDKVDIDHVVMNLPQSAPEFLDTFIGYALRRGGGDENSVASSSHTKLPVVHVYAFSHEVETWYTAVADVAERCARVMNCQATELGKLGLVPADGTRMKEVLLATLAGDDSVEAEAEDMYDGICWGNLVRDVSPHKQMVCLSFRLPSSVAFAEIPQVSR